MSEEKPMTDKPMTLEQIVGWLESIDLRIERRIEKINIRGQTISTEEDFLIDIGLDIQQLKQFLGEINDR